jgi:Cft2 family RNA processing exonuclease
MLHHVTQKGRPPATYRVDNFKLGADAYFLTHMHEDHLTGLAKDRPWHGGPIYATEPTMYPAHAHASATDSLAQVRTAVL